MPLSKQPTEIRDISINVLNSLENTWPVFQSVLIDSRQKAFMTVDAITEAVFCLSDMGFIIYEALVRDGLMVELRDAALTARGREFLRGRASWASEPMGRAA